VRFHSSSLTLPAVLACAIFLTGCKSPEERAEEYYESGIALMESGDYDRALVELRNVFEFNGSHRDARFALATILLEQKNNTGQAYGQYLRIAEQFPEDLETRVILSEIAFDTSNWDELVRHGEQAVALGSGQPRVEAIDLALQYREAVLADDIPGLRALGREVTALIETQPDNNILRELSTDALARSEDYEGALVHVEWSIEQDPEDKSNWQRKLALLLQKNDLEAAEAHLVEMVAAFPEDVEIRQALLRFYLQSDDLEAAEDYLRGLAAEASPDEPGPQIDLVNFIQQTQGMEEARKQLDEAIAASTNPAVLRIVRSGMMFSVGERDEALAELEDILVSNADTMDQELVHTVKVNLARMLLTMGNEVGARARVEEVLAEDAGQPDALKMQAAWQIDDDNADAAINSLRAALDRAPEDSDAMTLMAQAYTRSGRPELARDFLALAVEASGNAPEESLRYANVLVREGDLVPAEDVLLPALRLDPRNTSILALLGELYLRMEDIPRAKQVLESLNDSQDPAAGQAATRLEAQIMRLENGVDEALNYLERLATSSDSSVSSRLELIRARLANNELDSALELSQQLVDEAPENLVFQTFLATVHAARGELDTAIEMYRAIVAQEPRASNVWLELSRTLEIRDGEGGGAPVIDEALAVLPDEPNLLWAKASYLENDGDIGGAIDIYESLYQRNSNSIVIANNLASLLSTYRQDDESLERAWNVARRFRDTDIPAMQDTFGWILHRRGDSQEALPYLEAAAAGLPNDPVVQYHLGEVYRTLDRQEDAVAQYRLAVKVARAGDTRQQIEDARARIANFENGGSTEQGTDN
jgi:tetratricopeptide (TPR) repeat protein